MSLPQSVEPSDVYSKLMDKRSKHVTQTLHGSISEKKSVKSHKVRNNEFPPLRNKSVHTQLIQDLKQKCIEFTKLEFGWDGYDAIPATSETANLAMRIIDRLIKPNVPKPGIVPVCDGAIQIEWHVKNYEFEIEITKPSVVEVLFADSKTEEVHEFSLDLTDEEYVYLVLSNYIYKLQEMKMGVQS